MRPASFDEAQKEAGLIEWCQPHRMRLESQNEAGLIEWKYGTFSRKNRNTRFEAEIVMKTKVWGWGKNKTAWSEVAHTKRWSEPYYHCLGQTTKSSFTWSSTTWFLPPFISFIKPTILFFKLVFKMEHTLGLNFRWMWQLLDCIFWRSAPPKGGLGHPPTVCHYSKDHFVV